MLKYSVLSALPGPSSWAELPFKERTTPRGFNPLAGLDGRWKNRKCMDANGRREGVPKRLD